MEQPPVIPQIQQGHSRLPLWLALAANALNVFLSIQFYWVLPGAHIRPMAWAVWVFSIAVVGFVALPLELPMLRQRPRRFSSWLTVILALTPFPLASGMLHHAAWLRGFELAP